MKCNSPKRQVQVVVCSRRKGGKSKIIRYGDATKICQSTCNSKREF